MKLALCHGWCIVGNGREQDSCSGTTVCHARRCASLLGESLLTVIMQSHECVCIFLQRYILARLLKNGIPVKEVFLPRDHYKLRVDGLNEPPHAPPLKNLNEVVSVSSNGSNLIRI